MSRGAGPHLAAGRPDASACLRPRTLCSQVSSTLGVKRFFVLASFVPEGKFDTVPESELVIDDAKIILDDVFGGSEDCGDFRVLESFCNQFDDAIFPLAGDACSVALFCIHSCLRYNRVASFTRLIPVVIPNRRKRRLK